MPTTPLPEGFQQDRPVGITATSRSSHACARHGLEGPMIPCAGVREIPGGLRAPAPLEDPVRLQAQLASNLALAVNQALTASTPKTARSRPSAARRRGRVRPCSSTARSRPGERQARRSQVRACARGCQATPPPPACVNRGRGSSERPAIP